MFGVLVHNMYISIHRRLSEEVSGDIQVKKLRKQLREEQSKVEKLQKVRWCRSYISYYNNNCMTCACMYAVIIPGTVL